MTTELRLYAAFLVAVIAINCGSASATLVFLETFDTDTTDVPATYPGFVVAADTDGPADAMGGELRIFDGSGGGDNTLVTISATSTLGQAVFPEPLRVSALIGGTSGDPGGWSVGMVLGNVEFIFHPGFSGGAFRPAEPGVGGLAPNTNMGFTPAANVMHEMEIVAETIGGNVSFDVRIVDGNNPANVFMKTVLIPSSTVGPLDRAGFGRGGGVGGHGMYDNLRIVPEPSTLILAAMSLMGIGSCRRRRQDSLGAAWA